ncbi:hypothetical protein CRM89_10885 [Nocardia sp. FDAARGOS_372]|uniref:hypothetical protein n=1 Tax=Nocardia farcinica TaxID=37329 RepID=UPI000BF2469E|nr:hypothetical protein [Nocardia farcinica]MBF6314048.1 hypothetical protein [Nocardia farcinica]PEH76427.1 hypothetical protein CRM89_10885 [Nocardia sp. FDAARGOS_372]
MDAMVLTRWTRLARVCALAALIAMMLTPVAAVAQPPTTPSPPAESESATTFGFDQTCNELHDQMTQIPVVGSMAADLASAVCKAGNVASHPGQAVDAATTKLWDTTMGEVTAILLDGLGDVLEISVAWTYLPNDTILAGSDPNAPTLWMRVDDYTRQLQVWLLAISIAISAARIGIARAHLAAEHAHEAFQMMARTAASSWVAGAAILAGARMSDGFTSWLIADVTDGNARGATELLLHTELMAFSPGFIFVVALVGMIGAGAMAVLTIIRQALLVVAVAIYPLAAAASGTSGGRQSFQKLTAWIVAFLLFKPVAALVYMVAFVTADQTNTDAAQDRYTAESAHRALVGVVLLCSAAFVLPALMRLVAPALAVMGSGGGGAVATGAVAGAALAAGAGVKAFAARGVLAAGDASVPRQAPPPGTDPTGPPGNPPPGPRPALPRSGGALPGLPGGSGRGGAVARTGPAGAARSRPSGAGAPGTAGAAADVTRAAARATGVARAVDRLGEDTAGSAPESTGSITPRRGPGGHDIPR